MSFPEIPLLLYPSIAKRYGVEEALLFSIAQQLLTTAALELIHPTAGNNVADSSAPQQVSLSVSKWSKLTDIWEQQKLTVLCENLKKQSLLAISIFNEQVTIQDISTQNTELVSDSNAEQPVLNTPAYPSVATRPQARSHEQVSGFMQMNRASASQQPETMKILPVYDVPPAPPPIPLPRSTASAGSSLPPMANSGQILKNIGPAPSFGGSTGWKKRSNNELQTIFDQQEVLNKQLQSMTMDWKPSAMFYSTLSRSNIPPKFVSECIDEFILFYCDKNKKERSWDQKFLAWVKRAWVKQESNDNRVRHSPQQQAGSGHENSQRDSREKRKRITAAIMDIHDTNW